MSRSRDTADQINRVDSSAANATAITIDSSENVLVGTTDINPYDNTTGAGIALRSSGAIYNAIDGGTALILNRMTSDGTIAQFRKDGVAVGSWRSRSGDRSTIILDPRSGGGGLSGGGAGLYPTDNAGTISDGALTLGDPAARFKDLYLSGGVYLGGTGSNNKLDDYEFGSWNPTYTSSSTDPTFSPNLQNGEYTKIGRMVYASFRLRGAISGTKTGNLRLSGLPFTANSSPANGSGGVGLTENFGASNYPTNLRVNQSATYINLTVYDQSDPRQGLFTNVTVTSTSGSSSGNYIIGHVVYQTD